MSEVEEVIELLKSAKRIGAEKDDPEGVRYIQISDTLANQLAKKLEKWFKRYEAAQQELMRLLTKPASE